MIDGYEFALCLTHDVDRPYKTFQSPYYAITERDLSHLKSLVTSEQPYWQFEEIMAIEDELDVRSSFYFLNEKTLFSDKGISEWLKPENWKLYLGRYDISDPEIVDMIKKLDQRGWEVGLHGSFESWEDIRRLRYEKEGLESILGDQLVGGRQHYLNLERPTTWEYHREIGLQYDASLGSSAEYGFEYGYKPIRPFDDDFLVLPLTIMEEPLMSQNSTIEEAKVEVDALIEEAAEYDAVMTALWHPRFFNSDEFPGYREVYIHLIEKAKAAGAWIGSPSEYIGRINPNGSNRGKVDQEGE